MTIASVDDFLAATRQLICFQKVASASATAYAPTTVFNLPGVPTAPALAVGDTTSGVVPTSGQAGYPPISNTGAQNYYIAGLTAASDTAGWILLFDRLFAAGAFQYNANATLSNQPSFASRLPGGSYVGNGLEIWIETTTAFTGNPTFTIGYLNQSGASSQVTLALNYAPALYRCIRVPFAAGDTGVQAINSVQCSVATAGAFNINILRRLASVRVNANNSGYALGLFETGLMEIYQPSALYMLAQPDSTSTGYPTLSVVVVSK
jgi:hypothetical protein